MVSRITCEKSAVETISSNLLGLTNIIEVCKLYNSKLIYFSTSEIYGNIGGLLSEDRADINPNNRYGLTKLLGEKCKRKNKKPLYGWSIFATDDRVQLTRRVTEAQRKQLQNLH